MAIDWQPIAEIPDALKDGRQVLLWAEDITPGAEVGTWEAALPSWPEGWTALYDHAPITDVTHFAEITPP